MVRRRQISKPRKVGHGREHFSQLLCGLGDAFGKDADFDQEQARECWQKHRDVLLAEWIEDNPGTRPWAWWRFDAPERRQCTNGQHPHDCPSYKAHVERVGGPSSYGGLAFALTYGVPRLIGHGYGCEQCPESPDYELEVEYLHRLELLTPAEVELCNSGHTFEPQPAAEQCVEYRPYDRYCSEQLRVRHGIPKGSLVE